MNEEKEKEKEKVLCIICGKPAVQMLRDIRESTYDNVTWEAPPYRTFEPGLKTAYCEEHKINHGRHKISNKRTDNFFTIIR